MSHSGYTLKPLPAGGLDEIFRLPNKFQLCQNEKCRGYGKRMEFDDQSYRKMEPAHNIYTKGRWPDSRWIECYVMICHFCKECTIYGSKIRGT